ncbi:MAG: RNA polymerase sigma factor [Candidatus Kapaibacterium sp.]|jgi:RNA polymerase sigma-70 factor (ECF subfamily)|nr:RNA polymerase sigma factor [Candidatus Kapabacteria bacterium]
MELEEFTANVLPLKDKLFRFAKRLMQNHEEAEDLLQDVMLKLWVNRSELSRKSSVEAFAMAVTRNLCIDRFRSKQYQASNMGIDAAELDMRDRSISPEQRAEQLEAVELVRKAMKELPVNLQRVVELRDIQGLSYQEIAETMEMNINTLKVNLSRARKKIRELLKTNYDYNYNEK